MNPTLKKYLISSAVSFLTGFAIALVAGIDALTLEGFRNGAFFALIFVAVRAGIKGALEGYLALREMKA